MKNLAFILLAFSIGGCTFFTSPPEPTPEGDHSRFEAVAFAPENPYVMLRPNQDAHTIDVIARQFGDISSIDVEMTYYSGAVQQGVFDPMELSAGAGERSIFLGSCSSSTGVTRCYYHEGVENGTVTVTYDDGGAKKKRMQASFHLQEVTEAEGKLESLDRVASLMLDPDDVGALQVINVPLSGLPMDLPSNLEVVGQPYAFLSARPVGFDGKLTFTFSDLPDASGTVLFQWDEAHGAWKPLTSRVDSSGVSADSSSFGIVVAARRVS